MEIKGTLYKTGSVVVLKMDQVPEFGLIKDIFAIDTDVYYSVCSLLETDLFSHHFHAFEVHPM